MNLIRLLPVGDFDRRLVERFRAPLDREFAGPCEVLNPPLDPEFAYHPERQQYHSTEILAALQARLTSETWRLLAFCDVDLYIPILTFVFGEAQIRGRCAVVSSYRLRQEFYGLAADPELLEQRILKEAVHELGHTFGLTHCDDYQCAMAASHAVEWIDLKNTSLCSHCRAAVVNGRGSLLAR